MLGHSPAPWTAEVEGRAATAMKAGEVILIPADVPHSVRNGGTSVTARALVTHSRADKEKPLLVVVKK